VRALTFDEYARSADGDHESVLYLARRKRKDEIDGKSSYSM